MGLSALVFSFSLWMIPWHEERNGQHDLVRRFYGEICPMEEDPSAGHSLCDVRFQGHSIPQPDISLKIY